MTLFDPHDFANLHPLKAPTSENTTPVETLPPVPRRDRPPRLLIGIGCILGCVAAVVGTYLFISSTAAAAFNQNGCPSSPPTSVEGRAHFKLPPSARNLSSSCGGWVGIYADVRFEMNPADLQAFLASVLVNTPFSATGMPTNWQGLRVTDVSTIKSYLYAKYDEPSANGGILQEILIDTTAPAHYVVYVNYQAG